MADVPNLVACIDGGSLGNPGPSGIGLVIDGSSDGTIKIKKSIGHQDNNVAEYVALIEALQYALNQGAGSLHVFSDSELVVKQMNGVYACRSPRLYSLHWTCRKLARSLEFSISHIPREENLEANRLANSAVRNRGQSLADGLSYCCECADGSGCRGESKAWAFRKPRFVVDKSPYRSLRLEKANGRRKVALSPDFNTEDDHCGADAACT